MRNAKCRKSWQIEKQFAFFNCQFAFFNMHEVGNGVDENGATGLS
jgi:hypothetical protein